VITRRKFVKKAATGVVGAAGAASITGCHEYLADPFTTDGEIDVLDKKKIVKKISTVWMAPFRLNRDQWRLYLDWLVEHRFYGTVFSLSRSIGNDGEISDAYPKYMNLQARNPILFEHIDWMISEAESRGIMTHLLAFWANPHLNGQTAENMYEYCKFLGERYGNHSNVGAWVIGGDWVDSSGRGLEVDNYPKYDQMMKGLRDAGATQKMYHHNGSGCGHMADNELLDGWYTQFGHGWVGHEPETTQVKLDETWRANNEKECHVGEAGYPGLFFEEMDDAVKKEDVLISLDKQLEWYQNNYGKYGTIYHVNGFSEHWQCWTTPCRDNGVPKLFFVEGDNMSFEESLDSEYYSSTEHELSDKIDAFNALYQVG